MVTLSVGLAEMKFSRTPGDIIVAHGLGSCVGVVIYDNLARLGGLAHIVLPDCGIQRGNETPERFANSGIPVLLQKFKVLGGNLQTSFVKIAGGASMFAKTKLSILDIGNRNIEAVIVALSKEGIKPQARDLGGTNGRTVSLHISTGIVFSRMIGMKEMEL